MTISNVVKAFLIIVPIQLSVGHSPTINVKASSELQYPYTLNSDSAKQHYKWKFKNFHTPEYAHKCHDQKMVDTIHGNKNGDRKMTDTINEFWHWR